MIIDGKRSLAYIAQITDINPIPDADNIEVATINDGWKVVISKNDFFKVGDEVIDNCGDVLIITKTSQYDNGWHAICRNGSCGRILRSSIVRKTGRVYPEITKLFNKD